MKRFGYAIRTGGDPEIGDALKDGIERGTTSSVTALCAVPPSPQEEGLTLPGPSGHPPLSGEARRYSSEAVRRVAMMRHTPEEWAEMTEEARVFYSGWRYTPKWVNRLLVVYAMICLGVGWLFKLQDRVLK